MTYQIVLHPDALLELNQSFQWYEECSEGLGQRFLAAVQNKFDKLSYTPELYAKKKGSYRAAVVQDFPYTIIYQILEKQKVVFISFVFHTKRNPRLKFRR